MTRRRCISYLTIELKDDIPVELRAKHRGLGFWMRHLPDGLPVEPIRRRGRPCLRAEMPRFAP
ncbi:MAG: hypothetical protein MZV64_32970 [Ignavibacteriales bacterium]|nr:hypothetical protein [Ignavibacteriales bacterium]